MKGNNSFHLNESTIIAAVQMYFDHTFKESAPKVTSVKLESNTGYNSVKTFIIETESGQTIESKP